MVNSEERKGYIGLFRKIEDWKYFKDPYVLQVFIFCLLRCEYQRGNTNSIYQSGCFEITKSKMAEALGMSRDKLYKCLKILNDEGTISLQNSGKKTIIKVMNYGKYQENYFENHS